MLLAVGLYAERNIIGIRMDDKDIVKTDRYESMRMLAGKGINVLYYNEFYAIAEVSDDTLQHLPSCIKLASLPLNNTLFMVNKIPGKELNTGSTEFKILLDLGSSYLIESALDEIKLWETIQAPYTKLSTDPMRFPEKTTLPAYGKEFRTDIAQMLTYVSADSVEARLYDLQNFVTRHALADNRLQVAEWIRQKFASYGIADAELQAFDYNGTQQYNVVATIPGTDYPDEYIIVGGHHDSRSTDINDYSFAPGADDNASGTAAALEMARVIQLYGYQPPVSIRFVTFACEELGLWGSKHYSQIALDNEQNIRLMINHDMIANNTALADRPVKIMPYDGALDYADYAMQLTGQYTTLVPQFGNVNMGGTDSVPFWLKGFNVLFFNETEFSPVYHSPEDLVANLDLEYCAEVIKASLACAIYFADIPGQVNPPLATPATKIQTGGFCANWESRAHASGYALDVYTKEPAGPATDLFFSEYLEGFMYDKALEIYNDTGHPVDLGDYRVEIYTVAASSPSRTFNLSGILPNGETFVLAHANAKPEILAQTDLATNLLWFDGDDQLALRKISTDSFTDIFGRIGEDPGLYWGVYPQASVDRTLVRKNHIVTGVTENPGSGFPTLATDWYSHATDTSIYLGAHSLYHLSYVADLQGIEIGDENSMNIGGLMPNTCYYYVVRAENDYFTSENSNEIMVQTSEEPSLPVELASFTAVVTTQNLVNLAWLTQSETGMQGYCILRGTSEFLADAITISPVIPAANTSSYQAYAYTDQDLGESCQYFYWLQMLEISGQTHVYGPVSVDYTNDSSGQIPDLPLITELHEIYPNPFNPEAVISFSISEQTEVRIRIFNTRGQCVRSLDLGQKDPGNHRIAWDGRDHRGQNLGTGVYFVTMKAGNGTYQRKALLLK